MKTCKDCGKTKPLDDFQNSKTTKDGKTGKCRVCNVRRCMEYKRNNPDRVKRHNAKYYASHVEAHKERTREYQEEHPWFNSWAKANQKANDRGVDTMPYEQFRDVLLSMPQECAACGDDEDLTVDHIVPWIEGGGNTADNIQILCRSHNCSKGRQIIDYRLSVVIMEVA